MIAPYLCLSAKTYFTNDSIVCLMQKIRAEGGGAAGVQSSVAALHRDDAAGDAAVRHHRSDDSTALLDYLEFPMD
jgi:hypothetical protein